MMADNMQYVGRWSATPNRLRKDGTFTGTLRWMETYKVKAPC